MDREQYEKDLRRRQEEHLKRVHGRGEREFQPCMHDGCSRCHGTGVKSDGTVCVHMISCRCPKCRTGVMSVAIKTNVDDCRSWGRNEQSELSCAVIG